MRCEWPPTLFDSIPQCLFLPLWSSVQTLLPWPQVTNHVTDPLHSPGILKIPFLFAQPGVAWSAISESFQVNMPPRAKRAPAWSNGELLDLISVWGEEAVQSQLRSSHRNYDIFGKVSKDMMERGHDRDALQCRIKVKELRSAYRKARDANGRSGAPPATCRFYKELDAILGVNPTSTPSTTMDTSEPVWGGEEEEEEEEENGSDGGGPDGDTPESLEPCSQELFSHQEDGSQSQRPVLGGGQTEEQVPAASTLRPQPSLFSPAQRLQRLRKRPRKSKEDMRQEVMRQSIKENEKTQDWRERESRIRQENAAHRQQSTAHRQQSTDRLISILERQADVIQELVAMQKEEQYRKRKHPPSPQPLSQNSFRCAPLSPPTHFPQLPCSSRHPLPPTPVSSPPNPEDHDPYPLHSTPITMQYSCPEVQHSLHSTPDRTYTNL
ncbi:zinc finger and SCAN domain-containing protein 20-like isoform X1 [Chrysemys picta bellii]|uniref:zinc finger and SCAN domain-containing protein 20-like isoform X1 n=1 Tax=Chrysemys picta bellii TaxID=8478 RepID=UPI0032B16C14